MPGLRSRRKMLPLPSGSTASLGAKAAKPCTLINPRDVSGVADAKATRGVGLRKRMVWIAR
jgi:hypothetical protein